MVNLLTAENDQLKAERDTQRGRKVTPLRPTTDEDGWPPGGQPSFAKRPRHGAATPAVALIAERSCRRRRGDATGIVATADLAAGIGWDPKSLGKVLRSLEIPASQPSRQRIGRSKHPVSVQHVDMIITAIIEQGVEDG